MLPAPRCTRENPNFNFKGHGKYFAQGTYDCCSRIPKYSNERDSRSGCIRCDHARNYDKGWGAAGAMEWNKLLLKFISPPLKDVLLPGSTNKRMVILRFDEVGDWQARYKPLSSYVQREEKVWDSLHPKPNIIYLNDGKDSPSKHEEDKDDRCIAVLRALKGLPVVRKRQHEELYNLYSKHDDDN